MCKAKDIFGSKETKLLSSVWQELMPSALTWGGRQGTERASTRCPTALRTQCNLGGKKNKIH